MFILFELPDSIKNKFQQQVKPCQASVESVMVLPLLLCGGCWPGKQQKASWTEGLSGLGYGMLLGLNKLHSKQADGVSTIVRPTRVEVITTVGGWRGYKPLPPFFALSCCFGLRHTSPHINGRGGDHCKPLPLSLSSCSFPFLTAPIMSRPSSLIIIVLLGYTMHSPPTVTNWCWVSLQTYWATDTSTQPAFASLQTDGFDSLCWNNPSRLLMVELTGGWLEAGWRRHTISSPDRHHHTKLWHGGFHHGLLYTAHVPMTATEKMMGGTAETLGWSRWDWCCRCLSSTDWKHNTETSEGRRGGVIICGRGAASFTGPVSLSLCLDHLPPTALLWGRPQHAAGCFTPETP